MEESCHPPPAMSQTNHAGFDLSDTYKKGQLYVFPAVFATRFKAKKTKEKDVRDPAEPRDGFSNASIVDQKSLDDEEDHIRGEEAEEWAIKQLLSQFESTIQPTDPPCFILHNVGLKSKTREHKAEAAESGSNASSNAPDEIESDIICLHPKIGVTLVEVKSVLNNPSHRVKELVGQLRERKQAVTDLLEGLMTDACIKQVIALPDSKPEDLKNAKDNIKVLKDNPMKLLVGEDPTQYKEWWKSVMLQETPAWNSSCPESAYLETATRLLSVVRITEPGEALQQVASAHKRWLLTKEQMDIRDDPAKLLHIWGPPGAGKTLLLLHNIIRRLKEGKIVIVASGSWKYDLLDSHIGRAVLREQEEGVKKNLHICRRKEDIEKKLHEMREHLSQKVCLFTDELHDAEVFRTVVDAFKSKTVEQSWSADVLDLPHLGSKLYKEAKEQGWESVHLAESIRCPKEIIELLNLLSPDSPVQACNIPRPRFLAYGGGKEILDHAHHAAPGKPRLSRELECSQCREKLTEALGKVKVKDTGKSLSDELREQARNKNKHLRQWVVLGTGGSLYEGLRDLASGLRKMGIHAVCEGSSDFLRPAGVAVNSDPSLSKDDRKALEHRELVAAGRDSSGNPAAHIVWGEFFQGLEKPGVVMVHWDEEDFHPDLQTEAARTARRDIHRRAWFQAASRCQGRLVLWLLSPSPARSLLGLPPVPIRPPPFLCLLWLRLKDLLTLVE